MAPPIGLEVEHCLNHRVAPPIGLEVEHCLNHRVALPIGLGVEHCLIHKVAPPVGLGVEHCLNQGVAPPSGLGGTWSYQGPRCRSRRPFSLMRATCRPSLLPPASAPLLHFTACQWLDTWEGVQWSFLSVTWKPAATASEVNRTAFCCSVASSLPPLSPLTIYKITLIRMLARDTVTHP